MLIEKSVRDQHCARRADLAAIHIAKAQLRLNEDEYRDILATVCGGIRSSALLDFAGRKRFLAHLQACVRQQGPATHQRAVRAPLTAVQRKMWALWMQLADAGLVEHRTMNALTSFARRQTGVERLEWLNGHQADLVIESLKRYLKRAERPAP